MSMTEETKHNHNNVEMGNYEWTSWKNTYKINPYSDELDHPSEDDKYKLKENAYHHDENTWDMLNVVSRKNSKER
jgi:hypothetical protein